MIILEIAAAIVLAWIVIKYWALVLIAAIALLVGGAVLWILLVAGCLLGFC